VPSEVRFKPPEVVEVLVSPEEDEGLADPSLVSTRNSVVHALEQTPATTQIADVPAAGTAHDHRRRNAQARF